MKGMMFVADESLNRHLDDAFRAKKSPDVIQVMVMQ